MNENVADISDFQPQDLKLRGFRAYEVLTKIDPLPSFGRRDCYKVCLVTGDTLLKYSDKSIKAEGRYLFFGHPHLPYSSHVQGKMTGYACLFTEDFLKLNDYRVGSHPESPLFKLSHSYFIKVDDKQYDFLSTLFKKIIAEQFTDYEYKVELVRTYLSLIVQEAMKINPVENLMKFGNGASRISMLFLEMLERQFPIESLDYMIGLRTAQDFAEQLNVHVNYLNRSVKEVTGKPTTRHITERIISEAKALLQHTDWSVSEVAYSLGFEYPTYFNKYFKKNTGAIPKSFRGYSANYLV